MDWKIEVVPVPVTDIERAKRFYGEQVGFALDYDTAKLGDGGRIVQLTPAGSGCSIIFGDGVTPMAPGTLKGVMIVVADAEAARASLVEGGVDATPVRHYENGEFIDGKGGEWNSFVFFDDPDGNSWVIQERPSAT